MEPTEMLTPYELMTYLPGSEMIYDASFTIELTPKQNRPEIFDGEAVLLPGFQVTKKYTAVRFSDMTEGQSYMNGNTAAHNEFQGFLLFQKETGESYVVGEWVGLPVREWICESELWESDNSDGRRATQVLKKAGQGISQYMFNLHDQNRYFDGDLDDIYINPLTSAITIIRSSATQQSGLSAGIGYNLQHLCEFVSLCDANVPEHAARARDCEMFNILADWVLQSSLPMKTRSYIICHAPIFWWRVHQRFNFANCFEQLASMDKNFYQYVTFKNRHTSMSYWIQRAASDMVLGQAFDRTYYRKSRIMEFHRNVFNHYGAMVTGLTLEGIDRRLLDVFPDAYPKAYLELFRNYLPVRPDLLQVLRFGQYPIVLG